MIFSENRFALFRTMLEETAMARKLIDISVPLQNDVPADLGLGADTRPLGIGIERMWLAD